MDFLGGSVGKESTCHYRRRGFDPGVGKIPWRRTWQSTPVFLPGESHDQRSLAGYSPWGHKESNMMETTENICMHQWDPFFLSLKKKNQVCEKESIYKKKEKI